MDLKALQTKKVDDIVQEFNALNDAQLAELRAHEANEVKPRSTLIEKIDDELAQRAKQSTDGEAGAGGAAAGDNSAAASDPAWLAKEDYDGPLTIEQAQARNRRWFDKRVKPAGEPDTK
jgi:hypothetical protein